jgi:PAS domain S-box-containing protein
MTGSMGLARKRVDPMTIKHKIVGSCVGSALLVAAVGLFGAASMLRLGKSLRAIEVAETIRFRDPVRLQTTSGRAALPGGPRDGERTAADEMMHVLAVAQDRVTTSVRLLIAAAACALIVSLGVGLLVGVPLATRLGQLRDAAVDIGKGRRQERISVGSGDEIGELATAFNTMAEGVRLATDKAWENDCRFQEMAKAIREVYWVSDASGPQILFVSPAYEQVWGRSRESLCNYPLSFADAIVPEDRSRVLDALQRMENFDEKYRIVRPDGSMRWIHARGSVVRNQTGKALRMVNIAADVTERQVAEAALQGVNAQLERRLEAQAAGLQLANQPSV